MDHVAASNVRSARTLTKGGMTLKILGRHLIAEMADCDCSLLDDISYLETHLNEAVRQSGATIVRTVFHRYNPKGVSGVVVIAESHLSIHTWPEYGYAAVDFFTCGNEIDPYRAFHYLVEKLHCRNPKVEEVKRGIPSSVDELIDHKPMDRAEESAGGSV